MTRSAAGEASLGDLVARLAEQSSALVRDELRLAQLEMARKGRYAGLGAVLVGTAAVLAMLGAGALVAGAVLGLATAVPPWAAALLVAGGLFLLAAALALVAKRVLAAAVPPVPEEALANVRLDLAAVRR